MTEPTDDVLKAIVLRLRDGDTAPALLMRAQGAICELAVEVERLNAEVDRLQSPEADGEHLLRIVRDVVPIEDVNGGRLSFRCKDGTRLSFLCGPNGRLNGIVIQHGADVPPIRDLDAEQRETPSHE